MNYEWGFLRDVYDALGQHIKGRDMELYELLFAASYIIDNKDKHGMDDGYQQRTTKSKGRRVRPVSDSKRS